MNYILSPEETKQIHREANAYVRGGMHPDLEKGYMRNFAVQVNCRRRRDLTPAQRAAVAVNMIRGWVENR